MLGTKVLKPDPMPWYQELTYSSSSMELCQTSVSEILLMGAALKMSSQEASWAVLATRRAAYRQFLKLMRVIRESVD